MTGIQGNHTGVGGKLALLSLIYIGVLMSIITQQELQKFPTSLSSFLDFIIVWDQNETATAIDHCILHIVWVQN